MEYISKDDATQIIDLIKSIAFDYKKAKIFFPILDRLQMYIHDPDAKKVDIEQLKKELQAKPIKN